MIANVYIETSIPWNKSEDGIVTLRDIIDAVEGPIELSECASSEHNCQKSGTCPVRWVWQRVTDSINNELQKIRLSDMLNQTCESEENL